MLASRLTRKSVHVTRVLGRHCLVLRVSECVCTAGVIVCSTCQSCMNVRDVDGKSVLDRLIAKMPDAAMVSHAARLINDHCSPRYAANIHTYYYQYSVTASRFHSTLKTFLFCKSFPLQPSFSSSRLTSWIPQTVHRYF